MFENQLSHGSTQTPRLSTTLLALAWGITSAYILFYSLLISHNIRPCLAALVPLVITWATLERKRWGRLALLGSERRGAWPVRRNARSLGLYPSCHASRGGANADALSGYGAGILRRKKFAGGRHDYQPSPP